MAGNGFRVDPDELDGAAQRLEPLPATLRGGAAAELARADQASAGNPGYYTSAALDYAVQQLRAALDAAATQLTGYQVALRTNAENYRSGDARARQHLSRFFDEL